MPSSTPLNPPASRCHGSTVVQNQARITHVSVLGISRNRAENRPYSWQKAERREGYTKEGSRARTSLPRDSVLIILCTPLLRACGALAGQTRERICHGSPSSDSTNICLINSWQYEGDARARPADCGNMLARACRARADSGSISISKA